MMEAGESSVSSASSAWKQQFVALGGFEHLLHTLISLKVETIDSMLTLTCIESIVLMIVDFLGEEGGNNALLATQSDDM